MGSHIHAVVEIQPERDGPWELGIAHDCIPFFGHAYDVFAQLGMPHRTWMEPPPPAISAAARGLPPDVSPEVRREAEYGMEGFVSWYRLSELLEYEKTNPWLSHDSGWVEFIRYLELGPGSRLGAERVRVVFGID